MHLRILPSTSLGHANAQPPYIPSFSGLFFFHQSLLVNVVVKPPANRVTAPLIAAHSGDEARAQDQFIRTIQVLAELGDG